MVYKCSKCGDSYKKVIKAKGHNLILKDKKKATYFSKGYTGYKVCKVCKKLVTKGKSIAKLKLSVPNFKLTSENNRIYVKYNKVKSATGFYVRYKLLNGNWKTEKYYSNKSVRKAVSNLQNGKKYYVQLRSFLIKGKNKAVSSWSNTKTIKI